MAPDPTHSSSNSNSSRWEAYRRYHATVEDRSAVEVAYLAAQQKMRASSAAAGAGAAAGGGGGGDGEVLPPPPVSAYLPEAAEPLLQRLGLDQVRGAAATLAMALHLASLAGIAAPCWLLVHCAGALGAG
jgi:hypothetical protein